MEHPTLKGEHDTASYETAAINLGKLRLTTTPVATPKSNSGSPWSNPSPPSSKAQWNIYIRHDHLEPCPGVQGHEYVGPAALIGGLVDAARTAKSTIQAAIPPKVIPMFPQGPAIRLPMASWIRNCGGEEQGTTCSHRTPLEWKSGINPKRAADESNGFGTSQNTWLSHFPRTPGVPKTIP